MPDKRRKPEIVVVTGLSGSGKSYAARALEDVGFYCVDNLPVPLILDVLKQLEKKKRVAISADVRSWKYLQDFPAIWKQVKQRYPDSHMIFLWSEPAVLERRYRVTRRPHPLKNDDTSLLDTIRKEILSLEEIRMMADTLLDTTELNVHQLRTRLMMQFSELHSHHEPFIINLISFGFAYGVPGNVDMVFDVRFLPNPHYIPELQARTGQDSPVADYVFSHDESQIYFEKLCEFLEYVIQEVRKEHRHYFGIGIGCTGGRHRSVAFVEKLGAYFKTRKINTSIQHRDIDRRSA